MLTAHEVAGCRAIAKRMMEAMTADQRAEHERYVGWALENGYLTRVKIAPAVDAYRALTQPEKSDA